MLVLIAVANSEGSDKAAHLQSLARAFAVDMLKYGYGWRLRPKFRPVVPQCSWAHLFEQWIYEYTKSTKIWFVGLQCVVGVNEDASNVHHNQFWLIYKKILSFGMKKNNYSYIQDFS